jgi:hypothetical protein
MKVMPFTPEHVLPLPSRSGLEGSGRRAAAWSLGPDYRVTTFASWRS